MTGTFVRPGTLRSSASALASAPCLINVSLAGTPASTWPHYRPYLVLRVPRLRVLDGKIIGAGERVAARAGASVLDAAAAAAETADAAGRGVIIDSSYDADADDAAEAAAALAAAAEVVGGGAGAFDGARAWSRVTRLADALAAVTQVKEADEKKSEAVKSVDTDHAASVWPRTLAGTRTSLPPLPADGSLPPQTNEGDWEFTLDVTADGGAVELTVSLGRGVAGGVGGRPRLPSRGARPRSRLPAHRAPAADGGRGRGGGSPVGGQWGVGGDRAARTEWGEGGCGPVEAPSGEWRGGAAGAAAAGGGGGGGDGGGESAATGVKKGRRRS